MTDMDNSSLDGIKRHTQFLENLSSFHQRLLGFLLCAKRQDPIIRIARQLVPTFSHLPVEWSQKDITQQGRDHASNNLAKSPF